MRKLNSEALSVKQIYLYKVSFIGTCLPMMTETKFYMFSKINHKTIMKEEDRWGKTLNGTIAYSLQEASSGGGYAYQCR